MFSLSISLSFSFSLLLISNPLVTFRVTSLKVFTLVFNNKQRGGKKTRNERVCYFCLFCYLKLLTCYTHAHAYTRIFTHSITHALNYLTKNLFFFLIIEELTRAHAITSQTSVRTERFKRASSSFYIFERLIFKPVRRVLIIIREEKGRACVRAFVRKVTLTKLKQKLIN